MYEVDEEAGTQSLKTLVGAGASNLNLVHSFYKISVMLSLDFSKNFMIIAKSRYDGPRNATTTCV